MDTVHERESARVVKGSGRPSHVIYDFHQRLLRHGQRMCFYSNPRCEICPLTELCVYYQMTMRLLAAQSNKVRICQLILIPGLLRA